jgi:hypothetical protein
MNENYSELGKGIIISDDALLSLIDDHQFFTGSTRFGFVVNSPREKS